jgi:hypothetical protein
MEYGEVKIYASVYGLQETFMRAQIEGLQNVTHAFSFLSVLPHVETASVRELEDWKQQIRLALASLTFEEQLGAALLKEYDRVLQDHQRSYASNRPGPRAPSL